MSDNWNQFDLVSHYGNDNVEDCLMRYCSLVGMVKEDERMEIAEIHVGSDALNSKKTFVVSKRVLCHASKVLDKALNGGFKEGVTGQIDLPDIRPATFASFLHWLTTGMIYSEFTGEDCSAVAGLTMAVRVAIFGERIQSRDLQNAALTEMFELAKFRDMYLDHMLGLIDEVYNGTPSGHPLRKLFAMLCASGFLRDSSLEELKACRNAPNVDWAREYYFVLLEYFNEHTEFALDFWGEAAVVGCPSELPEKVDAYLVPLDSKDNT